MLGMVGMFGTSTRGVMCRALAKRCSTKHISAETFSECRAYFTQNRRSSNRVTINDVFVDLGMGFVTGMQFEFGPIRFSGMV